MEAGDKWWSAFLQALAGQTGQTARRASGFYQNWRKVYLGMGYCDRAWHSGSGWPFFIVIFSRIQIGDWWPRPYHDWYRAGGEL
jgi:hypothetical protein